MCVQSNLVFHGKRFGGTRSTRLSTYISISLVTLKPIFHCKKGPNANEIDFNKNEMYMANAKFRVGGLSQREDPTRMVLRRSGILSLYSTATQNYWRWGQRKFSRWGAHPMQKFGDTNILVSKNTKICLTPNAKHKICVSPNANPQRESVAFRLRWVPNAKCSRWPCTFFFVLCRFHLRWVPLFSEIWALKLIYD